ncbi:hypothetical protein DEA8626_01883 [Defluviimonas aquaemixtae]|uniref:AB hydrolase-1 domain-containing protein n=1 Tax=Albidovulum aquaemixtae TaxID=1542388 RepID=A0A2R8B6Z9_9RHOB|nr:alpha/beta hydrolase [Defluviimonas aquaemixtae]SPH18346.1 hypothetical protein DEA8626_01883 [Defluviimonas aquaemixtae]
MGERDGQLSDRAPVVLRSLLTLAIVVGLAGCSPATLPTRGAENPLLYDRREVAVASKIAMLVPGAFASADIFEPTEAWRDAGYAIVHYRFPGMDGLPLDHALTIDGAAETIVAFAKQHPDKKIRLLGYSTGGAVVIEAARRLEGRDLRAAAIAPAPEQAGGLPTLIRATVDIIGAAARAGSLDRDAVWEEYFRVLLFGRTGLSDPELARRSRQIVEALRDEIVVPDNVMSESHSRDLRRWRLTDVPPWLKTRTRFYVGREDPVFSLGQTLALARKAGNGKVYAYSQQGHLLFMTAPRIFDDVLQFFEGS